MRAQPGLDCLPARTEQFDINTWIPIAQRQMQRRPDVRYYELPTISRSIPLVRWWLDEAMRAGRTGMRLHNRGVNHPMFGVRGVGQRASRL